MDQLTVGRSIETGGRINPHVPQPTKHAFLGPTITKSVNQTALKRFARLPVLPTTAAGKSFGKFEDFFPAPPGFEAPFCAWHNNSLLILYRYGTIRLIALASLAATNVGRRRRRFCLRVLVDRICRK